MNKKFTNEEIGFIRELRKKKWSFLAISLEVEKEFGYTRSIATIQGLCRRLEIPYGEPTSKVEYRRVMEQQKERQERWWGENAPIITSPYLKRKT